VQAAYAGRDRRQLGDVQRRRSFAAHIGGAQEDFAGRSGGGKHGQGDGHRGAPIGRQRCNQIERDQAGDIGGVDAKLTLLSPMSGA
jgi:hypothetical protein